MSSYIEDIIQIEEEARGAVEAARENARERVVEAKEVAKKERDELFTALRKERVEKLKAQKEALVQLYRKIHGKGEAELENLKKQAGANKKRAVERIVTNLIQ